MMWFHHYMMWFYGHVMWYVSSLLDVVSPLYDRVSPLRDVVTSLCDVLSSLCVCGFVIGSCASCLLTITSSAKTWYPVFIPHDKLEAVNHHVSNV